MLVFINYWIEKCTVKHWNSCWPSPYFKSIYELLLCHYFFLHYDDDT